METIDNFTQEWLSACQYITAHTSGSTGKPKEIQLLKEDMRASARATNAYFQLGKGSTTALPLSVDYIAGKMMVARALEGGYRLVQLPVSNKIILPEDGTVFDLIPVVPSQLPSLLDRPGYTKRIRKLLIGGASPDYGICTRLSKAGYDAYISYGMTETCSHVALARANDPSRVFEAMPGISFETDTDCRLIIVSSHMSFRRLVTNDIVELLSDHTFRWRGRYDNVINSGGLKLHPEELERMYAPFLTGHNYYVTGRPDSRWGQAATLVIEGDIDTRSLLNALRNSLPHRLCPKQIETIDVLPRTPNDKIRRL